MNFQLTDLNKAIVIAVLSAILAYLVDLVKLGEVSPWIVAAIAAVGSLITSLGTTPKGNFAGAVPVR